MPKRKKKSLLKAIMGGVVLGVCKSIFEEPKTVRQKIAQQHRQKRRSWLL